MPASAQTGQQPPEGGGGDLPVCENKFRNELKNEISNIAKGRGKKKSIFFRKKS